MSCAIHRILTLKYAVNFGKIQILNEESADMTEVYTYSWSTDGATWTPWVCYKDYLKIAKNIEQDFYLRIHLTGSLKSLKISNKIVTDYNICIEPLDLTKSSCDNPNLFQPYAGLDCAILLQQQMSDNIICMFGIPVFYFQCDPDIESADYTFKEYPLHNVSSLKQIKMMVADGEMPSSNPRLTDIDFDWEIPWNTELSKTQFAKAFGDNVFPKAGDFIYVPLMKRMWEVNAAYDEKNEGFMWRSPVWKLTLVKYQEASNFNTEGFDDVIDSMIGDQYDEIFGKIERNEQERTTAYNQIQSPKFAATNLYDIFMEDGTRKAYTKNDAEIAPKILCNNNSIVARNLYKFKNQNGCVQYQKGLCGNQGTISFLIETPGMLNSSIERSVASFGKFEFELAYQDEKFLFGEGDLYIELCPFSTYLIEYQWNKSTFTRELRAYKHIHREDFPVYMLKPEQYWFDFERPIESIKPYDSDKETKKELMCQIHPWPLVITNIKYYNKYLGQEAKKELCKYTTSHENCIINDLARPINSGRGYAVR